MSQPTALPLHVRPGHATGPRTPEGKVRSSMNALKEGFRCARMIVPAGMEEENEAIVERYQRAFTPKSEAECIVFEHMVRDAWNLHRVELLLVKLADSGIDPLENPDPAVEKEYDRLERLQTNRIGHSLLPDPVGEGSMPALAINTLAMRSMEEAALRERKPANTPLQFRDFLTDEEKVKFLNRPPQTKPKQQSTRPSYANSLRILPLRVT